MKTKTSVTLDTDLVEELDAMAEERGQRSRLIELAIREFVERRRRAARDARDVELINRHAEELNREALDVLEYQVDL